MSGSNPLQFLVPEPIRVTIVSNSDQSLRAPLILPWSHSSVTYYSQVLKAAMELLGLEKPSRIFLQGGREVNAVENWSGFLQNDVVLLISVVEEEEDLVMTEAVDGPLALQDVNPYCPVEIFAKQAFVAKDSKEQLKSAARFLPGILYAVGQPNLHPGTTFPTGAVLVSRGWVHPPLVGSDIGCGMAWYKTNLSRSHVEGDKGGRFADKLRGLEGPWRDQETREKWLEFGEETCSAGEHWDKALGTVGAGSHFSELQVVEASIRTQRSATQLNGSINPLHEDEVVLLVHSGSRGYGGDVSERFTKEAGCNSIHDQLPLATEYLSETKRACAWAAANRDLIALRFLACLEPGESSWRLGVNPTFNKITASVEEIHFTRQAIESRKVVDVQHNNIEVRYWDHYSNKGKVTKVYIHRRGAAATVHGPRGERLIDIFPLPGSRATPTLIMHPLSTKANLISNKNAFSIAHGAGRAGSAMTRAKAAGYVSEKYAGKVDDLLRGELVKKDKQGWTALYGNSKISAEADARDAKGGCWVVCEDKKLVWEEAPEAYKDVWDVADDLVDNQFAQIWGWCRPLISYKVRRD